MIDLMAISSIERDTEMSYVRRERDWLARAQAAGRDVRAGRLLPMLPAGMLGARSGPAGGATNGQLASAAPPVAGHRTPTPSSRDGGMGLPDTIP